MLPATSMNINELEVQIDSAIHSLRQRLQQRSIRRRHRRLASEGGNQCLAGGGLTRSSSTIITDHHRAFATMEANGQRQMASISLPSSPRLPTNKRGGSIRRLLAKGTRLFGGKTGNGNKAANGNDEQEAKNSNNLPSGGSGACSMPVSPHLSTTRNSQASPDGTGTTGLSEKKRRRNSAGRLREMQRLLRALNEQREAWTSPPGSPRVAARTNANGTKNARKPVVNALGNGQMLIQSTMACAKENPIAARTTTNPNAQMPAAECDSIVLNFSHTELGIGYPLLRSVPQLALSPKRLRREAEADANKQEKQKRISLTELEMALRGGTQPEPSPNVWQTTSKLQAKRRWQPVSTSSPPTSTTISPSNGSPPPLSPSPVIHATLMPSVEKLSSLNATAGPISPRLSATKASPPLPLFAASPLMGSPQWLPHFVPVAAATASSHYEHHQQAYHPSQQQQQPPHRQELLIALPPKPMHRSDSPPTKQQQSIGEIGNGAAEANIKQKQMKEDIKMSKKDRMAEEKMKSEKKQKKQRGCDNQQQLEVKRTAMIGAEEDNNTHHHYIRRLESPPPHPAADALTTIAQQEMPGPIDQQQKKMKDKASHLHQHQLSPVANAAAKMLLLKSREKAITIKQEVEMTTANMASAVAPNPTKSVFTPAGIQQLLFRHRQRRPSANYYRSTSPTARDGANGSGEQQQERQQREPPTSVNQRPLMVVKSARSEPRLLSAARSVTALGGGGDATSPFGSHTFTALSLSPSTTALDHLERLRDRVSETKYVTAVFESRGGIGPVLEDVQMELAHWLGPDSRLLAVACEVHWSVPERFRSRMLEIQLKDCLHAALRENNRRILGLNDDTNNNREQDLDDERSDAEQQQKSMAPRRVWSRSSSSRRASSLAGAASTGPFPLALAKSRTEESCARDAETDSFQGIYRRFYPALLCLQDPATVQAHKGYWTLENLADTQRSPLVPRPAQFLYKQVPGQLAKKSVVAVNMAVLRLRGDNRDYDAEENNEEEMDKQLINGGMDRMARNQQRARRYMVKESNF